MTPSGVRDGDPDALAGLCDRRGPAVLAYCEVVAGHAAAAAAAAEAFGSFRAGVVATADLASLNPEALLISATRHAAARHAAANSAGQCAGVPALLAARADRSITLADHDWLEQHLATCWSCRAPVARFEAADRAYREPPDDGLAPEVAAAIVAAMTAAAPVRGSTAEPATPAGDGAHAAYSEPQVAATNGHQPYAAVAEPLDQQTSAYELPTQEPQLPPAPEQPRATRERRGRRAGMLGGALAAARSRRAGPAGPTAGPPSMGTAAAAAAGAAASRRRPARDVRTGSAIEPRAAGGASLPRPSRIAAAGAVRRREHSRLRASVVLPVALVIVAIIAALAVAGVFGGGEPESAPQSFAPTESVPSNTAEAPVVVVPGAASRAAAVEKAKERARAAARKRRAAARAAASDDDAPATATPPPAAAATPAAAPATPPPPPAAANTGATSGKPKIDAGNGATGAEQLPPPQDTSTIPEIAPPVEPSVAPGE